jgi:hypothetical protein
MEMICHQDVDVNPASTFDFGLSKTFQKETVIIVGEKSSSAIVSALDNVMRISRNCDSRRSCHAASRCQQTLSGAYRRISTSSRKKFSDPIFPSGKNSEVCFSNRWALASDWHLGQ